MGNATLKKQHGGKRPGAGRKPTKPAGKDPVSAVRFPVDVRKAIDAWGEEHQVGRSEAIRRLVEIGLKAKVK